MSAPLWTTHDTNENAMAITLLLTYGKFRMLDPADLTWNKDRELFAPSIA